MSNDEMLIGDAFDKKCAEAVKFTKAKHTVLSEDSITPLVGGDDPVTRAKLLRDYSDLWFYSAGPVYTHCCVPFDIFEQFKELTGYEGPRHVLKFEHHVFNGLAEWGHILEGIAIDAAEDFTQFLTTQTVRRNEADYWVIRHQETLIADPLAFERNEFDGNSPTAVINLFTPSGNAYHLLPRTLELQPMGFVQMRPEPEVVKEAQIVATVTLPGR